MAYQIPFDFSDLTGVVGVFTIFAVRLSWGVQNHEVRAPTMIRVIIVAVTLLVTSELRGQTMVIVRAERTKADADSSFVMRYGMDEQDVQSIPEFVHGIEAVYPTMSQQRVATVTDLKSLDAVDRLVDVTGLVPEHRLLRRLKVISGSDLQPQDFELGTSRCLISTSIAEALFGEANPVGRYVTLQGIEPVLVTGVFEHPEDPSLHTSSLDIVIPIKTFRQRAATTNIKRSAESFSAEQCVYCELQIHVAEGIGTTTLIRGVRKYLEQRYRFREFQFVPTRLRD